MNFFKPPYHKIHIITLASLTFFLALTALFIFKNYPSDNLTDNPQTDTARQVTGQELRQEHLAGVEQLDDGNGLGALLVNNLMVIDIRSNQEFAQGHIAGAQNILLVDLKESLFIDTSNIVIYGQNSQELQQAAAIMQQKKVASVQTLSQSLDDLKTQGYTITKD